MRYAVVIERGESSFGAYVPDLPGCVAVGESEDEARRLISDAIDFHLQDLQSSGSDLPEPRSSVEYVEVRTAA